MYKPTISIELNETEKQQIRLLLIGKPGTGKTFSVVTTFPNPVVADFDNSLTSREVRAKKPLVVPFYDIEWVTKNFPTSKGNSATAFKAWLNGEAKKLEPDQTLVIDSLSSLQATFHQEKEKTTPTSAKTGEPDGFYVWGEKLKYFRDIHVIFMSLKCSVVMTAHEKEERNPDTGFLLGKVSPYMTGGFVAELGSKYTDIFRSLTRTKKDSAGKSLGEVEYLWQVRADDSYDLKSRMNLTEKFVSPGYEIFQKGY